MDNVNFSTYIRELAGNLLDTYKNGDSRVNLSVDVQQDTLFDVESAVPLGVIINEIFSNSLKYAFPDRTSGEIRISFERKEKGEYKGSYLNEGINKSPEGYSRFILTVSDNGVGIPETFSIETAESLGLQIVNVLMEQLDGSVRLNRDRGTEYVIEFTAEECGE